MFVDLFDFTNELEPWEYKDPQLKLARPLPRDPRRCACVRCDVLSAPRILWRALYPAHTPANSDGTRMNRALTLPSPRPFRARKSKGQRLVTGFPTTTRT